MNQLIHLKNIFFLAAIGIVSVGCQSGEDNEASREKSNETDSISAVHYDQTERLKPVDENEGLSVNKAFVVVNPRVGSEVVGAVTFTEVEGGVRIIADIGGLSPGKHGFHIHEHGDCSAPDASSAGGHFNPTDQKHGGPDSFVRHVGDLGNLEADEYGFAHYDRIDRVVSLTGEHSIIGKAVIVHEKEDDLQTNPTGNAGKRLACGKIIQSEL